MMRRWIVVGDGTSQMAYVGKTCMDDSALHALSSERGFLVMDECRALRTLLLPSPEGGVVMQNQLTPIGITRGAVRMHVLLTTYYWPDEDEATFRALTDQIKRCEEVEMAHRAKEAGLVTPDVRVRHLK